MKKATNPTDLTDQLLSTPGVISAYIFDGYSGLAFGGIGSDPMRIDDGTMLSIVRKVHTMLHDSGSDRIDLTMDVGDTLPKPEPSLVGAADIRMVALVMGTEGRAYNSTIAVITVPGHPVVKSLHRMLTRVCRSYRAMLPAEVKPNPETIGTEAS